MEDYQKMKKLVLTALSLVVLSGVSSAAVQTCTTNPNAGDNFGLNSWTIADLIALNATGGCTIGDKVFYNFGGALDQAASTIQISGPNGTPVGNAVTLPPVTYQLNVNSAGGVTAGNYTFNYSLSINPALVTPGLSSKIALVTAGIADNGNDGGTQVKTITGGASCTASSTDSFGNVSKSNCTGISATQINVSEVFNFTANNSNQGGVRSIAGMGNTFVENFTATNGTPEPVSMLLFGSGLLAFALVGRKKLARK